MNIISKLLFQVSYIEKLLKEDLKNEEIIYNYFICEKSTKLLDKHSLQEFLTNTKIENLTFLKSICNHCYNIHNLWNNELNDLPHKTLKERFIHSNFSDGERPELININSEFHAIYLMDEKFEFYYSDLGKKEFFKEYYFYINRYSIPKIVQKCNDILYYLTACFPTILQVNKANNNESENEVENNDFIKSTIEDYLEPIKNYFNAKDYNLLVNELDSYFKYETFTNSNEIIKIINNPNVKLIGWQLKELYHASFNDNRNMHIDYLKFGKQRISIFKDVSFDEKQFRKSNLYKYFHTKP